MPLLSWTSQTHPTILNLIHCQRFLQSLQCAQACKKDKFLKSTSTRKHKIWHDHRKPRYQCNWKQLNTTLNLFNVPILHLSHIRVYPRPWTSCLLQEFLLIFFACQLKKQEWWQGINGKMASVEVAIKCCHGRFLSVSGFQKMRCHAQISINIAPQKLQAKEMCS